MFYMDVLRILACIFVVGNHTLGSVLAEHGARRRPDGAHHLVFSLQNRRAAFFNAVGRSFNAGDTDIPQYFQKDGAARPGADTVVTICVVLSNGAGGRVSSCCRF